MNSRRLPQCLFLEDVSCDEKDARGGGGFADVWRGMHNGTPVALKRLRIFGPKSAREKTFKALLHEALIWRQLSHPSILKFLGVSRTMFENHYSLVSPWMDHGTITEYLLARPDSNRPQMLMQIGDGMCYLHELEPPVVHGDLRGANILVNIDGYPQICDFGLARILDFHSSTVGAVTSGVKGTTRWMAPELLSESGSLTVYSDVYAFGCVCLEVFCGTAPFGNLREPVVPLLICKGRKPADEPPREALERGLNKTFWILMQKCWRFAPAKRPTMRSVIRTLTAAACESGHFFGSEQLHPRANITLPSDVESSDQEPQSNNQINSTWALYAVPVGLSNAFEASTPMISDSGLSSQLQETRSVHPNLSHFPALGQDPSIGLDAKSGKFRIHLDDPTWSILPVALHQYNIDSRDWQNYALFICYGATEYCLRYDEKPLRVFQRLTDEIHKPEFKLKHISHILSPIVVAERKHQRRQAARKVSVSSDSSGSSVTGLFCSSPDPHGHITTETIAVSYAIAIYPYMAEQVGEFEVAVGDVFIITARAPHWWRALRDPTASGVIHSEMSAGWLPRGCLLETKVPVAIAIAEAMANQKATALPTKRSPIMPANILSNNFRGLALINYRRKDENEVDLVEGDVVRVCKRYKHWAYVVKEDDGDRGWVPAWFIGKVWTTN